MSDSPFNCHKISEGKVSGEALISKDEILFYFTDPETGQVVESGHCLQGRSVADKILIFPAGKGSSSVQVDGLYRLLKTGHAPRGMIVERADTILVTSAIIMEIPLVDRIEPKFYEAVRDGDQVELDADGGRVTIISK